MNQEELEEFIKTEAFQKYGEQFIEHITHLTMDELIERGSLVLEG